VKKFLPRSKELFFRKSKFHLKVSKIGEKLQNVDNNKL
jgi:hypothetical protein